MARGSASRKSGLRRLAVAGAAAVALAMFGPTATEATRVSAHVSSVEPHSLEAAASGHEGWRRRPRRGFFFLEGSATHENQSSGQPTMKAKQDGEEEGDPWEQPKEPIVPGPFYPWHDKDGKDGKEAEPKQGTAFLANTDTGKQKQNFFFSAPDEPSAEETEKPQPVTYPENEESQGKAAGGTEDGQLADLHEGEAYHVRHEPASAAEVASSAKNEGREFFKRVSRRS